MNPKFSIRNARQEEYHQIGSLMVEVYSLLDGFPQPDEQPAYYNMLRNVGELAENPNIELFVAVTDTEEIGGAVVYINDMKDYGSGGTATKEKNACGFRLLAVSGKARGQGLGKLLTQYCIQKGRESGSKHMIIHTTKSMQLAWGMYERLGFQRAEDLDFIQSKFSVFGFRLKLKP